MNTTIFSQCFKKQPKYTEKKKRTSSVFSDEDKERIKKSYQTRGSSLIFEDVSSLVMNDTHIRARFYQYLKEMFMEETVLCLMEIKKFDQNTNSADRVCIAKTIIENHVMDFSPFQVNLSSNLKNKLVVMYTSGITPELCIGKLFRETELEIYADMRNTDIFHVFIEREIQVL